MLLVLDTSAFISGFDPSHLSATACTVPRVVDELRKDGIAAQRAEISHKSGKLEITPPSRASVGRVKQACQQIGEYALSQADIDVIALALDLSDRSYAPYIVSDDYSIQNVAEHLQIRYMSLVDRGIQRFLKWTLYCPACFKRFPEGEANNCPVCATPLKRKPTKGSPVKFKK